MAKKELQVSAIENGTVIDHIPADKLFDVINVLGITGMDNAMTFGANLKSSKLGKKAIIKIWDIFQEVYDNDYKAKFEEAGITYFYTLIDDAVARVIRSEGGYIWALCD